MQVRICPKCNAENKFANVVCSKCYATLEGAEVREVAERANPEVVHGSAETAHSTSCASAAAAPPPYGSFCNERLVPAKSKRKSGLIVLLVVLIAAAGFAAWWFLLKPDTPGQVASAFMKASRSGDIEQIKPLLCSGSKAVLDAPGVSEGFKRGFNLGKSQDDPETKLPKIGKTTFETDTTALVEIIPVESANGEMDADIQIQLVLVKEAGRWGVDLQDTTKRVFQKMMPLMIKKGFKPPGS